MSLNQPYIREESWELCSTSSDHSSEISPTAEKTESRVCIMMRYTFHVDIKVCQLTISLTVTWFISMTSAIMFSSMLTICKFVSVWFPLETMVWSFMTMVHIVPGVRRVYRQEVFSDSHKQVKCLPNQR